MRAGDLRHRVTVQDQSKTADGMGGNTVTWQDVATVWAQVTPTDGQERYEAQQQQSQVTHEVLIRHRSGIDASMRVMHEGRALQIEAIINVDERSRATKLLCVEGD